MRRENASFGCFYLIPTRVAHTCRRMARNGLSGKLDNGHDVQCTLDVANSRAIFDQGGCRGNYPIINNLGRYCSASAR